ncbi:MAG: peptidylprolyl isomerase [Cytophagaceae bacterium BCCC1]|nr:MAG: peptidylprolyl isomerase [Cytophagaceae bacterium BCCC1]
MKKCFLILVVFMAFLQANAQRKDYLLTLTTSKGVAHMVLYDETPLHKANFLKLVKEHYYDSLLFHRVIEKFMIQGGDPNSKNAKAGAKLGSGGGNLEKIPFEFTPLRVHKKGALAAASNGNPEKMSNPVQFYIVQGRKLSDEEVSKVEKTNDIKYTNQQRADYISVGGYPSLDNKYTVFGEVVDNFKLIDEIAAVQKDEFNRPVEDVKMVITVKKTRKKKITRIYGYKYEKKN